MSDSSVSSVSRLPGNSAAESAMLERATTQAQTQAASNARPFAEVERKVDTERKAETERKTEITESKESTPTPAENKAPLTAAFPDVRLRFNIDPHTHDVTVMMVDKGSGKVIRSIPPEELRNLNKGNLVELLA